MKQSPLSEKIMHSKVKDYSFLIAFFLIFSFFVFFAIKPNLETAFSLKKELAELKVIDKEYENVILYIRDIQTILEVHREDLPMLDEALPSTAQVSKVVDDIKTTASASGILIKKISIAEVNLNNDSNKKKVKNYIVDIETDSKFESVKQLMDSFLTQRRVKEVKKLQVSRDDKVGSESSTLNVKLEIEGLYL